MKTVVFAMFALSSAAFAGSHLNQLLNLLGSRVGKPVVSAPWPGSSNANIISEEEEEEKLGDFFFSGGISIEEVLGDESMGSKEKNETLNALSLGEYFFVNVSLAHQDSKFDKDCDKVKTTVKHRAQSNCEEKARQFGLDPISCEEVRTFFVEDDRKTTLIGGNGWCKGKSVYMIKSESMVSLGAGISDLERENAAGNKATRGAASAKERAVGALEN